MGRKAKDASEVKCEYIHARTTIDRKEQLERIAIERGLTVTETINDMVEQYLKGYYA